jgi:hypothetical protein
VTTLPRGAYGFNIHGIAGNEFLVDLDPGREWPDVHVRYEQALGDGGPSFMDDTSARYPLGPDEYGVMDRRARSAILRSASPADDGRLVHPFLGAIAAVFSQWHGHEVIHGGAFAGPAGAWGMLGDQGAGKSSTLAALHLAGQSIVADDLLVLGAAGVFAGPRCVDLRPDAAAALGVADRSEWVRGGRYRLPLEPVPAEVPMSGTVFLAWGETLGLRPLGPAECLIRLVAQRLVPAPVREPPPAELAGPPEALLRLASAPAWELRRPRDPAGIRDAVDMLVNLAGRGGEPGGLE